MGKLNGKIAAITGGAQGIGRAIVEAFIAEGAMAIAVDLSELVQSTANLGAIPCRMDITDQDSINAFAGQHPRVNILVNCAGYVHEGTILDCNEAEWQRTFEVNVSAPYRFTRALLPGMLERRSGNIINISSVASSVKGLPNRFAYGSSKAALIGLTKALAADFVGKGIRCNAICPGTVLSPSLEQRIEAAEDREAARHAFVARQPMVRLGQPREIANAALYLASDDSDFVTGSILVVDGGLSN